jgi:hypothetical protein
MMVRCAGNGEIRKINARCVGKEKVCSKEKVRVKCAGKVDRQG